MKTELVTKAYEVAKERYAEIGIDTEKVLKQLQDFHLSLHCWQADDVKGFEVQAGALSGGIQSTGDFPGAARNIDELRQDILKAKSLIPGNHRLNLHEIYGDFKGKVVDRDEVTVEYFQSWIDWAKENNTKLDFNSSSFSHPKSGSLSLANPDEGIRQFWVEHTKRCRDIANAMGEAQNDPCIMNLWVHDGCKDVSVNHALYRNTLKKSLDEIFEKKQPMMKDCIEGKVFGIGLESFTVGSHDFYTAYAAQNDKILTIDTGHYHPTESPADKVSALLPFLKELMLHVSRPVRWDSDHVTIMDDPTQELFFEIVRANALDRVHYVLTSSMVLSTVSVLTLLVLVLLRSACFVLFSNQRRLSLSLNLLAKATRCLLLSRSRRLCHGRLYTTSSAFATMFLLVRNLSQTSISMLLT